MEQSTLEVSKMDRKAIRASMPDEAIELYNLFIHSVISRRAVIDHVRKYAVGGLTTALGVVALMADYAGRATGMRKDDERIKASYETRVPSPNGSGSIRGYFVRPTSGDFENRPAVKLPGINVIHEKRGLNPYIEDVARRFALQYFMVFAPDGLTPQGGFPGDDYRGGQMFMKADQKKMFEDFVASANWLRSRADCSGKIGATGFCFGGGIANSLAVRLGPDIAAAAPFYGAVPMDDDIAKIKAAILVHHGALDARLSGTWPHYHEMLDKAGAPNEGHIYPERGAWLLLRRDTGTL